MAKFTSFWTLLVLLLSVAFVFAEEPAVNENTLNVEAVAQFPDNPFGLIVNGQKNAVVLTLTNKDAVDASIVGVSGKVTLAGDDSKVLRNLPALRYDARLVSKASLELPYEFYSEFAPGELALTVYVDLLADEKPVRIVGYSGNITVTDPESSLLDAQLLFLYAVMAAGAVGILYVVRQAFFGGSTKKPSAKKAAEPTVRAAHRDEKGQMVLDESWIPEHHLKNSPKQSPRAKKRTNSSRK
ncbi:hypothetical protein BCR42DRAFT_367754 [Absidia repens]|uniref:Uncharacterized protein n=1 Tax=Absidia repens TaxID=90262 RepID=A0A1X2ITK1_9FUNG|nr:hypothetical protein BCR42DRAFT_367754 [Absidia repens]